MRPEAVATINAYWHVAALAIGACISLITLNTRLAISRLHRSIIAEQEARCKECRNEYVTRRELEQIEKRIPKMEARKAHA